MTRRPGRWRGGLRTVVDVAVPLLMALFLVATVAEELGDDSSAASAYAAYAAAVVQGVALAWRRTRPELVTAVTVAGGLVLHVVVPELVVPFAALVAVGSLAAARSPLVSLPGLGVTVGLAAANFRTATAEDAYFTMVFAVAAWALGEIVRNRRVAIGQGVRRAVAEERARIAREMHDVVAHSVSVIVVQAAAADDVFETRPDQARQALRSIEATGREALGELRRLLAVVGPDDQPIAAGGGQWWRAERGGSSRRVRPGAGERGAHGGGAEVGGVEAGAAAGGLGDSAEPVRPQPSLARVDELAVPLRAAGLDVTIARVGEPRPLPPGVDVSAYRIVQEALTNTLRHARATRVDVTVTFRGAAVELEVVDDGQPAPAREGVVRWSGGGHGVIGMRERADMLGGTIEVGPLRSGGFRVRVDLPAPAVR